MSNTWASAGRLLELIKGAYDPTTEYHMLDLVFYNGSTYIAKDTTLGNAPTNTTYWQIFAQGTASAVAGSYYGTCASAANVQNKVVSVSNDQNFTLQKGVILGVKFTYTNTFSASALNHITINVNSEGAYPIYFGGTEDPIGTNPVAFGKADFIHYYLYDGVHWIYIANSGIQTAEETPYDNTQSGATGTNAQDVIDELFARTLGSLSDVNLSNLQDGQTIRWNATTQKWENVSGGGSLATLTDVDITTPTDGQVLRYNGITQEWENVDAPASSPNPNLLMNPWFTINQRGATDVLTSTQYGVDRWYRSTGTTATPVTFGDGSVTLPSEYTISQRLENQIPNGFYTASVKLSDGNIYFGTAKKEDDSTAITLLSNAVVELSYTPTTKRLGVRNNSNADITITAVKLELGSTSTLALDTAPDYTTELLKCCRYLQVFATDSTDCTLSFGATKQNEVRVSIPTNVPFRTTPTLSTIGTFFVIKSDGSTLAVSSVNLNNMPYSKNMINLQFVASGIPAGGSIARVGMDANSMIILSAEL